jgi:hypothetical protein
MAHDTVPYVGCEYDKSGRKVRNSPTKSASTSTPKKTVKKYVLEQLLYPDEPPSGIYFKGRVGDEVTWTGDITEARKYDSLESANVGMWNEVSLQFHVAAIKVSV